MAYKRISPQPVVEGGTGAVTLTGILTGNGTSAVTANAVTQHGILIGGVSNAASSLGVASNGQLAIGSTGADPVLGTLTAGTGITITNGAGSITVAATGTTTLTYTLVNTTPYVVLTTDDFLGVDSTAAPIQINLPNAPVTGRVWYIKDLAGTAQTNNITVTTVGGVVLVDAAATYVMNTQYSAIGVLFNGTKYLVF